MSSIMMSREESERVIGKRLRKKKKEGNDAPLREDQQPHQEQKKTKNKREVIRKVGFSVDRAVQGAAAPLESNNRCSRTLEENQNLFFWRCKVQSHH